MKESDERLTDWDYIDDVVIEILDMLPQEERAMYFRTLKALYGAGIVKGQNINKIENKNN
jgi:hypothetical protein